MNQVAGPFVPQQPAGFGSGFAVGAAYPYQAPPSAYYGAHTGIGTPQQHAISSSQAFARAAYHDGGQGGMAPSSAMMQAQQQSTGQQYPYTTAPYSQSVPAQALSAPSPAQPAQLVQQQQQALRQSQSASPQQRQSPNAASHQQQTAMAAPPLPQSPANQHQAATIGQHASPSPRTPQSPGSASREQQRITLLLDINLEMLQEVNRLQAEGKGGALSPNQQAQLKAVGQPSDLASEDYIQVMRRVQANLGYLMPKAQNEMQKAPRGPALMSPPPHMPRLQPKYDQLKELFPDWTGLEHRLSQGGSNYSPKPNGQAANGMGPFAANSPAQA